MEPVQSFTVTHLVSAFRQALLALIPVADAVGIGWRDDEMYDDWEHLQEALFTVLVDGTIRGDLRVFGPSRPIARYDVDRQDYTDSSWVEVVIPGRHEESLALVRFLSIRAPFDTVNAVRVGGDGPASDPTSVSWSDQLRFRVQLRNGLAGTLTPIDSVSPTDSVVY